MSSNPFVYEPVPPEQQMYHQNKNHLKHMYHPNDLKNVYIKNDMVQDGSSIYERKTFNQSNHQQGFTQNQNQGKMILPAMPQMDNYMSQVGVFSRELFETPLDRQEPMVKTGTMYNPYTGQTIDTFESPLPPPDRDNSTAVPDYLQKTQKSNFKLISAQGGYDQNAAKRKKEEVFEVLPTILDGRNVYGDALYADNRRRDMDERAQRTLWHNRNGEQYAWSDNMVMDRHKTGFVGYQNMYRPLVHMPETQRHRQEVERYDNADNIPNPRVGDRELMQELITHKKIDLSQNYVRQFGTVTAIANGGDGGENQLPKQMMGLDGPKSSEVNYLRPYGNISIETELPTVKLDPSENPLKTNRGILQNPYFHIGDNHANGGLVHGEMSTPFRQDSLLQQRMGNVESGVNTGGLVHGQMNTPFRQDGMQIQRIGNVETQMSGGLVHGQMSTPFRQDAQTGRIGNLDALIEAVTAFQYQNERKANNRSEDHAQIIRNVDMTHTHIVEHESRMRPFESNRNTELEILRHVANPNFQQEAGTTRGSEERPISKKTIVEKNNYVPNPFTGKGQGTHHEMIKTQNETNRGGMNSIMPFANGLKERSGTMDMVVGMNDNLGKKDHHIVDQRRQSLYTNIQGSEHQSLETFTERRGSIVGGGAKDPYGDIYNQLKKKLN